MHIRLCITGDLQGSYQDDLHPFLLGKFSSFNKDHLSVTYLLDSFPESSRCPEIYQLCCHADTCMHAHEVHKSLKCFISINKVLHVYIYCICRLKACIQISSQQKYSPGKTEDSISYLHVYYTICYFLDQKPGVEDFIYSFVCSEALYLLLQISAPILKFGDISITYNPWINDSQYWHSKFSKVESY